MSEALSSPCAKTVLTGAALGGGLGASFGKYNNKGKKKSAHKSVNNSGFYTTICVSTKIIKGTYWVKVFCMPQST